MRESLENLKEQFSDEDYRYGYAESFLNSYVAAQIKILREQRKLTQAQLAEKIGTKQAGISRLENVNYTAWKVDTLTRLARALGVRLRISFEEFGTLPDEVEGFGRASLERSRFEDDPLFSGNERAEKELTLSDAEMKALGSTRSNDHTLESDRVLKLINKPLSPDGIPPKRKEDEDASNVNTPSTGSRLHGVGGAESQWQSVPA